PGETLPRKQARGTILCTYDIHSSYVVTVAWEPGGDRIASSGGDGLVRVWEADSGRTLLTYRGHPWVLKNVNMAPTIYMVAWSPDGVRIASTCGDETIRLWNAANGKPISRFKTSSAWVYTIAWSPDGRRLALANGNSTAEILDASTGQILLTYQGHNKEVRAIAWSPDGSCLATASNDTTVQIWDAANGTCLYTHQEHAAWTTAVAWSPDGTR